MEFNNWKRLDLFLDFEENPLKKYEYYFKAIDFNFVKPQKYTDVFGLA